MSYLKILIANTSKNIFVTNCSSGQLKWTAMIVYNRISKKSPKGININSSA